MPGTVATATETLSRALCRSSPSRPGVKVPAQDYHRNKFLNPSSHVTKAREVNYLRLGAAAMQPKNFPNEGVLFFLKVCGLFNRVIFE